MRVCTLLVSFFLLLSFHSSLAAAATQQNGSNSQVTDKAQGAKGETIEGTVVSTSRATLTIRIEGGNYQLFTFSPGTVRSGTATRGERVRVIAGPADENGVRAASSVTVIAASTAGESGTDGGCSG